VSTVSSHPVLSDQRFDVVVIGGGPAGGVVAAHAARCGASVLIVEAGPELTARTPWFSHDAMLRGLAGGGVIPAGRDNPLAVGLPRVLGGGFAVNSGLYRWPSEERLGEWSRLGVDLAALDAARSSIESRLTLAHGPDRSTNATALTSAAASLGLPMHTVDTWATARFDPRGPFISDAVALGAELVCGVEVDRITISADDTVVHLRNGLGSVRTAKVLLAAGAIGSPELLVRSGMLDGGYAVSASPMLRSVLFPELVPVVDPGTAPVGRVQVDHGGLVLSGCGTAEPWQLAATHPHLLDDFNAAIAAGAHPLVWYTQFTASGVLHRTPRSTRLYFDRHAHAQVLRDALSAHRKLTSASGLRSVLALTGRPRPLTHAPDTDFLVARARLSAVHLGSSVPAGVRVSPSNGELEGFEQVYVVDSSALPSLPGVNPQASVMAFAQMCATEIFDAVRFS
jgi:choline dehydrogenase-like flavoprotein